ncbi:hypothetical protein FOCC_FOCC008511 [Frankliniella occidentalis]|nr:hypothetical protein FOCC_FOCC008511 [Frankliniella occidentalis]
MNVPTNRILLKRTTIKTSSLNSLGHTSSFRFLQSFSYLHSGSNLSYHHTTFTQQRTPIFSSSIHGANVVSLKWLLRLRLPKSTRDSNTLHKTL